jgi:hypothetical protein
MHLTGREQQFGVNERSGYKVVPISLNDALDNMVHTQKPYKREKSTQQRYSIHPNSEGGIMTDRG